MVPVPEEDDAGAPFAAFVADLPSDVQRAFFETVLGAGLVADITKVPEQDRALLITALASQRYLDPDPDATAPGGLWARCHADPLHGLSYGGRAGLATAEAGAFARKYRHLFDRYRHAAGLE